MEARVGGTLVDIDLAMVPFGASRTNTLVAGLAVLASSSVPTGLIVTVPVTKTKCDDFHVGYLHFR